MKRHAVAAEPPAELEPIEIITSEQAEALAVEIAPAVDAAELRDILNDRGTLYRWFLHLEDRGQPAPVRAELDQLSRDIGAALATLRGLSEVAKRKLDAAAWTDDLQHGLIGTGTCRAFMVRLRRAAGCARHELPRGGGRPRGDNVRSLCGWLASSYDDFAGGRAAYDQSRKNYMLNRRDWIERVVRLVDPEVTAANLSTALREIRKPPPKTA